MRRQCTPDTKRDAVGPLVVASRNCFVRNKLFRKVIGSDAGRRKGSHAHLNSTCAGLHKRADVATAQQVTCGNSSCHFRGHTSIGTMPSLGWTLQLPRWHHVSSVCTCKTAGAKAFEGVVPSTTYTPVPVWIDCVADCASCRRSAFLQQDQDVVRDQ